MLALVPNKPQVLVRPIQHSAPAWNPYLTKDINSLESMQKFALKVSLKQWNTPDTHTSCSTGYWKTRNNGRTEYRNNGITFNYRK